MPYSLRYRETVNDVSRQNVTTILNVNLGGRRILTKKRPYTKHVDMNDLVEYSVKESRSENDTSSYFFPCGQSSLRICGVLSPHRHKLACENEPYEKVMSTLIASDISTTIMQEQNVEEFARVITYPVSSAALCFRTRLQYVPLEMQRGTVCVSISWFQC
jgi:hypothetical protein